MQRRQNIAFAGYARSGKDTAADALVEIGYTKVAFGTIIKRQVDPEVQKYLGFSAFTENDDQKRHIRPLLEQWGEVFYDAVMKEFFETLPATPCVNSRLVREREAREWVRLGGIIVEISRPGFDAATNWERDRLDELRATGLIYHKIVAATPSELRSKIVSFANSLPLAN